MRKPRNRGFQALQGKAMREDLPRESARAAAVARAAAAVILTAPAAGKAGLAGLAYPILYQESLIITPEVGVALPMVLARQEYRQEVLVLEAVGIMALLPEETVRPTPAVAVAVAAKV